MCTYFKYYKYYSFTDKGCICGSSSRNERQAKHLIEMQNVKDDEKIRQPQFKMS